MLLLRIILFFLLSIGIYSQEKEVYKEYKKQINFNFQEEKDIDLNPDDYAGYNELKQWANYQMLRLSPDNPIGGIKDGICRMIPPEGFSFFLTIDTENKKKVYLYLDLTTYQSVQETNYPVRSLTIYINQKKRHTVYFNPKQKTKNPTMIEVDPTECLDGRVQVLLVPDSSHGKFWGIWDVFYSYVKEQY